MLSPSLLSKKRWLNVLILMSIGLFGYCEESFSSEKHAEFCKQVWAKQAWTAEWDKKHPRQPYRPSAEERLTDTRNNSACVGEKVRQAQLEEEGMLARASSAASAQVKAPPPAARASPPTKKP